MKEFIFIFFIFTPLMALGETYQQTEEGWLKRSDGTFIPPDERNRNYQEYKEWLGAGNVPISKDPKPVPIKTETDILKEEVENLKKDIQSIKDKIDLKISE